MCLMNRRSVNGQVSYSNPLDGSESPRSPSAQSPRSLASLRPKDRLALAEMSLEQMFMAVDPDGSGEITFRELYKMIRHNPDLAPPPKVVHAVAKAEPVVDLGALRQRIKLDMFKMELQNEVLTYTRSRPGRGANNPTIGVGFG